MIELINRTSQGFKEGQKWKCNHTCGTRFPKRKKLRDRLAKHSRNSTIIPYRSHSSRESHRRCSQCDNNSFEEYETMLSHSKTLDYSSGIGSKRSRSRLMRQMATYESDENDTNDTGCRRKRCSMPVRQWTTDPLDPMDDPESLSKSKAISSPMVMSNTSNAFLLRPVSRNSGKPPTEELKSPAAKAAIAAAIAEAKGGVAISTNLAVTGPARCTVKLPLTPHNATDEISMKSLGAEIHSAPNGTIATRIRRQRTTESAPTGHLLSGGVAIRHLPRQHSNASAYSMANPSTFSHQGITLVRGASCSLVDIPTYLGPALHTSTGVVEVSVPPGKAAVTNGNFNNVLDQPRPARPRLQLDLTKKSNQKTMKTAKTTRKTKWTILCVGLTLLTMCVTLVGTMLSIGSQYQEMMVHRKWEQEMGSSPGSGHNKTSTVKLLMKNTVGKTSTMSPLLSILKISKEESKEDQEFVVIDTPKNINRQTKKPIQNRYFRPATTSVATTRRRIHSKILLKTF